MTQPTISQKTLDEWNAAVDATPTAEEMTIDRDRREAIIRTLDHAEAFETFYTDLDPDDLAAFDEYLAPQMETP